MGMKVIIDGVGTTIGNWAVEGFDAWYSTFLNNGWKCLHLIPRSCLLQRHRWSRCKQSRRQLENSLRLQGVQVNEAKSLMYSSRNVEIALRQRIQQCSSVEATDDLGRYLGVPASSGRMTRKTYYKIAERVKARQQRFRWLDVWLSPSQ